MARDGGLETLDSNTVEQSIEQKQMANYMVFRHSRQLKGALKHTTKQSTGQQFWFQRRRD